MSLDYPIYEQMLSRNSRAAMLWRVGDMLYYLGLVGFFLCSVIGAYLTAVKPASRYWVILALGSAVVIWFVGGGLKSYAHKIFRSSQASGLSA